MKNEKKKSIIKGGATLWARQTIESEIFINKPDKWFKIWFYLVNRASHKDTKRYKKGEAFLQQDWICEATSSTKDQVKKCIGWLRDSGMISTKRSTRGTWLKVCKYSHFQRLDNYYYNVEAPDKARGKHVRSTTEAPRYNKNVKNDKNDKEVIYIAYKEKINSLSRLTDEAKKKIQVRLKTYSEEDLLKAIDNFSKNNWWMEHNSKRGVAWFFHSEDRIDGFMNLEPEKKNEFGYVDKKPYFRGEPMVKKFGKWKVISNGEWKEFAGDENNIEYK